MKKKITLDTSKKVFPLLVMLAGIGIMLAQWIVRLNIVSVVAVAYCCILSAIILLSLAFKKKVYAAMVFGYAAAMLGVAVYYIIWGADAGFGAFSSGLAGFQSAAHPWLQGEGNLGTRLLGNLLLVLPNAICLWGLFFTAKHTFKKEHAKKALSGVLSVLLIATAVLYVLTMNLRSKPNTVRLWEGQDNYLKGIDKNAAKKDNPNVLFILMDDLGWGDISLNGAIYDTPNMDSIGENGVVLDNFYSSYSVCSPARFAAMLGDEITIAEAFKAAGYNTGAFGKWHLGDYGEYLPTNQGFDYFYGSHHVNDMTPFYHVREENGQYEIAHGTDEMFKDGKKDQSRLTQWIHEEMTDWIANQVQNSDEPFFAFYASPWPHAPVFAGDEFDGTSGMGTYVDCVTEVDHYLGLLFDELEDLGVLEDTIIIFTSDNGPALEGSVSDLRGGKYLAYEGGQKVPFMIRWDNDNGALGQKGTSRTQSATLVDLYPTLMELCGITGNGGQANYLPSDRVIDGVSMTSLLQNDTVIHTKEHPILHMKREDIKAIQYTVPTADVRARYPDYNYDVLTDTDFITFKYFDRIQNDNSAFFDKYRKNWLHILTDDAGENYNRTPVYPEIADEYHEKLDEIQKDFKDNRRGIIK